ncbi:hypothetical protein [Photobacterium damselae]|uniref:hypothetical protein n=1 Tax=Photobacterium damselae TaxID=38293 RepID=UPI0040695BE1
MECKCGGEISSNTHYVKTSQGFSTWHDSPFQKELAPYSVVQATCKSCCRNASIVVFDVNGNEVLPRWPEKYEVQPSLI